MKPTQISSAASNPRLSLAAIAGVFLRVVNSTWASGSATIANIRHEFVERRGALGESEFTLAYALARIAPGTNVLAFCAAVGWRLRGWPGAIVAVAALSVPAAVAVVLLTTMYERWAWLFTGAMAAVVGVICGGGFMLMRPYLARRRLVRTLAILVGAFAAGQFISPVQVLVLAGAAGWLWRER